MASKWSLRLKLPEDLPAVGKFTDGVDLHAAVPPLRMYFRDEELAEDDQEPEKKDAEYFRKKRMRKYFYKKKNLLLFRDSNTTHVAEKAKFLYEGKLESNASINTVDEKTNGAPFQYALLQFVRKENKINVIPVGDYYYFQKHGMKPNESLEDIKDRIEQHAIDEKSKIAKFKAIEKALLKRTVDEHGNETEEYVGGFDANALFSGKTNKKKGSSLNGSNSKHQNQLDDTGIDMDELRDQESMYRGDYAATFADDEDHEIRHEQTYTNDAENGFGQSDRYTLDGDNDDSDAEEDDLDEDEGTNDDRIDQSEFKPGMVDDTMEDSAKEARKLFSATVSAIANAANSAETSNSSGAGGKQHSTGKDIKSVLKRTRVEMNATTSISNNTTVNTNNISSKDSKGVKFSDKPSTSTANDNSSSTKRVKLESTPTSTSNDDTTSAKFAYPLSDEGVKSYILNRGGAVRSSELMEVL